MELIHPDFDVTMASLTHSLFRAQISTFSALSHSNFRLYFAGQLVSMSGTWMQTVAQGWLVFHLTQSPLWLGIVACSSALASLLCSPFAGVVVEGKSRRQILLVTQSVQMLLALTLAYLTFSNLVQVWHVVILAFILGITNAFDAPSRQAIVKDMVGADDLASGISLNSLIFNTARIFGPTVAGITLATVGAGWCFLLNGASFLAVIASLLAIKVPAMSQPATNLSPIQQLRDGLRFSRRHETIKPLLLLAAVTSILSVNIMTQLPAFASKVLDSPIYGYSTLTTAQGSGAILAGLLVVVSSRFGRGRVISVMLLVFCFAILIVSRITEVFPAALLMGIIGFSMVMMFVTMNTMIQIIVPDEYRGRVLSLYTLTFFGLNPFGALALGQIADQIGVPDAIALYAILNGIIVIGILARWPALWQNKRLAVSAQLSAFSEELETPAR